MARLIGAQRMVLQAILDAQGEAQNYVEDFRIAQSTRIALNDVRHWLETIADEDYVEVARTEVGLSASITAKGRLALEQFRPFQSEERAAGRTDRAPVSDASQDRGAKPLDRRRDPRPPIDPMVGIITALPHESAAVRFILGNPPRVNVPGSGSGRIYWKAEVSSPQGGIHRIVIAQAGMGNNVASILRQPAARPLPDGHVAHHVRHRRRHLPSGQGRGSRPAR